MGSGPGDEIITSCSHTEENQTYQIITDDLIMFAHITKNLRRNAVVPFAIKLRKDEIIFLGSGGCGQASAQRISILTRVE